MFSSTLNNWSLLVFRAYNDKELQAQSKWKRREWKVKTAIPFSSERFFLLPFHFLNCFLLIHYHRKGKRSTNGSHTCALDTSSIELYHFVIQNMLAVRWIWKACVLLKGGVNPHREIFFVWIKMSKTMQLLVARENQ